MFCNTSLEGCITCKGNSTCTSCVDKTYFLNDKKCVRCANKPLHCVECENSYNNCTRCEDAYFPQNGLCKPCGDLIPSCRNCLTALICGGCEVGYYLNEEKRCSLCMDNCASCKGKNQCTTCKEGYFPNAEGVACVKCSDQMPQCITCKSGSNCTQCS